MGTTASSGKYKNLLSNTLIFAIGSFSSKLLSFLLMSLYTRVLETGDYSAVSLITNACNLILPVMHLSVPEAIIRFGLDKTVRKRDVYTTGVLVVAGGYLAALCCMPLVGRAPYGLDQYTLLIYLYILTSAFRNITTHFVRALGLSRLFALDGMFTTLTTIGFNVLFLVRLKMGVTGYVLSIILADGLSAVLLFLLLGLHRFIRLRGFDRDTARAMLRYCVPLVPTAIFWWITNLSDQFMVRHFCGEELNGLYSSALKLPSMITLVSAIFTQAWQISAFTEYKSAQGSAFFSNVFRSYYTFVFLAASGIIWVVRPLIGFLWGEAYADSWQYVPFLVLAVSFSCLVTFLGSIYNAEKKNGMVTITTMVGAVVNVALNLALIPRIGPQGAAIATFASFLVVFLIRAVDTQRYLRVRMQPARIALNLALLLLQCWLSLSQIPYSGPLQLIIVLLIVLCNLGYILFLLRRLLFMVLSRR